MFSSGFDFFVAIFLVRFLFSGIFFGCFVQESSSFEGANT